MYSPVVLPPQTWAERTFGQVAVGDVRRTRRVVRLAARMMRRPAASLPEQVGNRAALKASYQMLAQPAVTHQALSAPHWQHTRTAAGRQPLVLLVQDTTFLDYRHFPCTTGLGPLGTGAGRGLGLQTVLAVVPHPRQVVGIAHDEPFVRQPAPAGETATQRRHRPRESDLWLRAVQAIGPAPVGRTWVHVGDRGADIFTFLVACRAQGCHFLVRAAQDRRACGDTTRTHLLTDARARPAQATRALDLPARPGQPARQATVQLSVAPLTLLPPRTVGGCAAVPVTVVRVWEEPATAPAGVPPLEWVLITSVPTATVAEAWERVDWYTQRWTVEDYHMCLKTGCRIEQRHLRTAAGLRRLLGIVAPIAVRLLALRDLARLDPTRLATAALPHDVVRVVAALAGLDLATLTVGACWRALAMQGGYQGRPSTGPPGWQTLWRGWQEVMTLLDGIHLADHLPP